MGAILSIRPGDCIGVLHIVTVAPEFKGYGFPPPIEHRIVAVSLAHFHLAGTIVIQSAVANTLADRATLLSWLQERLVMGLGAVCRDRPAADYSHSFVVTFNGNEFLLPVIQYESLRLAVPYASVLTSDHFKGDSQASVKHFAVSDWFSATPPSISNLAQLCGLPPRPTFDYAGFSAAYITGGPVDLKAVCQQLELDVVLISCEFMRIALVSGAIKQEVYTDVLRTLLKQAKDKNELIGTYLRQANVRKFLLLGAI